MKCEFGLAYRGKCGKEDCEEHKDIKCKCGEPAIVECWIDYGPMVCGEPLCKDCDCHQFGAKCEKCDGVKKWGGFRGI